MTLLITPPRRSPCCRLYKLLAQGRQLAVPVDSSIGGCMGKLLQTNVATDRESFSGLRICLHVGLMKLSLLLAPAVVTIT